MEELFFDDITENIQKVYINLFLLAIKKRLNLRKIVESVAEKIAEYKEYSSGFKPVGIEGMLFLTAVAKMMDYSLFDIMYLSGVERQRIIDHIIDEIDITDINEYEIEDGNSFFVYDLWLVDDDGEDVDYELTFSEKEHSYIVSVSFYCEGMYGFPTNLIYDSVVIWEHNRYTSLLKVSRFIKETIEELKKLDASKEAIGVSQIDFKDFFIHTYRINCNHDCISVNATVPIYSDGKVTTISFQAEYCAECGVYYIPESIYQNQIEPKGNLLCQVISLDEYLEYKKRMCSGHVELKPQSILYMLGYTVNAKDNLNDDTRQTILKYAIESGLITKKLTIFYLQEFIKRNGAKVSMEEPVKKWKRDLQWVLNFDKKGDIVYGVKRIIDDTDTGSRIRNCFDEELPFG